MHTSSKTILSVLLACGIALAAGAWIHRASTRPATTPAIVAPPGAPTSSPGYQPLTLTVPLDAAGHPIPFDGGPGPVPVHPWQIQRANHIRGEQIDDLIAHLADFDDFSLAATSTNDLPTLMSPAFEDIVVVNLSRVRRLKELGESHRGQVIDALRQTLRHVYDNWPTLLAENEALCKDRESGKASYIEVGPTNFEISEIQALAASYLLAELKDYDSLPLLMEGYSRFKNIDDTPGDGTPVAPGTLLMAMHSLIASYPPDHLSPAARMARDRYLRDAAIAVPHADIIMVTRWDAKYDESDPRLLIMDPTHSVLAGQKMMPMTIYPDSFIDGTEMSDANGEVPAPTIKLLDDIDKLVKTIEQSPR